MQNESMQGHFGFSLDAAHAADQEKRAIYPPRPAQTTPDFDALCARILEATTEARRHLGDA